MEIIEAERDREQEQAHTERDREMVSSAAIGRKETPIQIDSSR
jgi:hypothetical protein